MGNQSQSSLPGTLIVSPKLLMFHRLRQRRQYLRRRLLNLRLPYALGNVWLFRRYACPTRRFRLSLMCETRLRMSKASSPQATSVQEWRFCVLEVELPRCVAFLLLLAWDSTPKPSCQIQLMLESSRKVKMQPSIPGSHDHQQVRLLDEVLPFLSRLLN